MREIEEGKTLYGGKKMSYESAQNARKMAGVMFDAKDRGQWQENACDRCHRGMLKRIYDFQREHRDEVVCSTCDKKERLKIAKEELM